MMGAPGPPALPPKGPTIEVFCLDGGSSQTSETASQGVHRGYFFMLMVGAPGPQAPPRRGAIINVFCVDGDRSWTSNITSQGAHHRRFLH
jgi:hypothetical protein